MDLARVGERIHQHREPACDHHGSQGDEDPEPSGPCKALLAFRLLLHERSTPEVEGRQDPADAARHGSDEASQGGLSQSCQVAAAISRWSTRYGAAVDGTCM